MICKAFAQARILGVVAALFVAAVALLIAPVALAQISPTSLENVPTNLTPLNVNSSETIFLPPVTYDSGGSSPSSVAVGDLNGDGKPDLVVANQCQTASGCGGPEGGNGVVAILLGNGDGTFRMLVSYSSGGQRATSVAVADVNGDHVPDVVVANCGPIGAEGCQTAIAVVGVLLGNGDGTFQPAVRYQTGWSGAYSVVVADVNGDSKPDVVVGNIGGSSGPNGMVSVLLGNGDGTFKAATTYASGGWGAYWLAISDVNRDAKPDIFVVNNCANPEICSKSSVGVLLGNGDGTFQPVTLYDTGGVNAQSVVGADVNLDGNPDLVVAEAESNGLIGVLLNEGDGTFLEPVVYATGGVGAWALAVADANADSKPDVLVTNVFDTTVGLLLGKGDGTFLPVMTYDAGGSSPASITVTDVNGDGGLDAVVAECPISGCGQVNDIVGVLLNDIPFCTNPPVITLSATPTSLWPPNGKMVPVTLSGTITDTGCTITSASYAVADEYGQVQPSGLVTVGVEGGAYSFTVSLQASRLGSDSDGRLYTVSVTASNNAGKSGSQAATVIVPHDQGH